MGTMARTAVIAGTATAVSGSVSNRQQKKQMAKQQQAAAAAPAPAPSAPAPEPEPSGGLTDDAVDQLKKLGDLKAAGVLSDEEFTAAKAKILGI
jgi:hypothetical protein